MTAPRGPRVPLQSLAEIVPHERGEVEGATPLVLPFKVRDRAGMTIAQQIAHFSSPFRGGRSLHSDPCGKAVEPLKKRR